MSYMVHFVLADNVVSSDADLLWLDIVFQVLSIVLLILVYCKQYVNFEMTTNTFHFV